MVLAKKIIERVTTPMFSSVIRASLRARVIPRTVAPRAVSVARIAPVRFYSGHHEETFEEFTAR